MRIRSHISMAAVTGLALLFLADCGQTASSPGSANTSGQSGSAPHRAAGSGTRVITDAAGRHVRVPDHITRVATIGSIPDMIVNVFAAGKQSTIVTRGGQGGSNGVGANGKQAPESNQMALYQAYAPQILTDPSVEGAIGAPVSTEALLALHPDVVIAPAVGGFADNAIKAGIPVVLLTEDLTPAQIEQNMTVLGQLFNEPSLAARYQRYFTSTLSLIHAGVASIPASQRLSGVFLAFSPLRVPIYATNYLFSEAGATSVTTHLSGENVQISIEKLLLWNPDVILVQQTADQQALYKDSGFSSLRAVRDHRVYLIPQGLNIWTDNSPEFPLAMMWLAKNLYPGKFKTLDLTTQVRSYYQQFGGFTLSSQMIAKILSGP